jgi:uridylate kinase
VRKGRHSSVDGVYSADPRTHPDAVKLESVTYIDVLQRGLQVMDSTAITFCMDNSLPIIVFDVTQPGNIMRALTGDTIGTLVSAGVPSGEDR